jgi:hypothetical protein
MNLGAYAERIEVGATFLGHRQQAFILDQKSSPLSLGHYTECLRSQEHNNAPALGEIIFLAFAAYSLRRPHRHANLNFCLELCSMSTRGDNFPETGGPLLQHFRRIFRRSWRVKPVAVHCIAPGASAGSTDHNQRHPDLTINRPRSCARPPSESTTAEQTNARGQRPGHLLWRANESAQAAQPDQTTHHHKGDRQGGDAADVPGQAAEIVVCEVGNQPQPGMNGQSGGAGQKKELHAHEHPDRVGRVEQPLEARQNDPAHP